MPDYAYNCRRIRILETLSDFEDTRGRTILFCEFQCEDEHGHLLTPEKSVVALSVFKQQANIVIYPENILSESASENDYERLQAFCKQAPDYTFYNPEWVAEQLAAIVTTAEQ